MPLLVVGLEYATLIDTHLMANGLHPSYREFARRP